MWYSVMIQGDEQLKLYKKESKLIAWLIDR